MGGDMGVPRKNVLDYAAEVIPGLPLSLKPGKDGKDLSFRKDIGKDLKQLGGILWRILKSKFWKDRNNIFQVLWQQWNSLE